MVGHTGMTDAVKIAIEAVDEGVGKILEAVKKANGIVILSADHGNSDDMYEVDKKTGKLKLGADGKYLPKTAHSLNSVPAIIYDPADVSGARLADVKDPGIANLAATCLTLLGFQPPEDYTPSLVEVG
jgi:2,3-bisphosphoglycerate-independent phosphoglycerate mutase